ncbi:SubName: Full=Uncharacterized protein {ECO:0000313/EMBL:CCA67970.1} [Serendipita indica DSM 11827]|nr:SubName: Full=Uncharacterized protein {ECO:0000313/EMBL:CCA67970.1} [Serendipita indica DSM 11827]
MDSHPGCLISILPRPMTDNKVPRALHDDVEMQLQQPSASTSSGSVPIPLPSLTSHPPLRLQRKLVVGTKLRDIEGSTPLILSPISPTTTDEAMASGSPEPSADEPTFPCPFCSSVFKKVGHLNRHTLKHTGTRFQCEYPGCDKTFSRLDNMRTHMKNMHPTSQDWSSGLRARTSPGSISPTLRPDASDRPTSGGGNT